MRGPILMLLFNVSPRIDDSGVSPLFSGAGVFRMAVEDIGPPIPGAGDLQRRQGRLDFLGSPEGELAIAAGCDLSRHRARNQRRLQALCAACAPQEGGSRFPQSIS